VGDGWDVQLLSNRNIQVGKMLIPPDGWQSGAA